jgi:hypothetical protein
MAICSRCGRTFAGNDVHTCARAAGPGVVGILLGVITACLGAFPAASLVALLYGFPVPFAGKLHGPAAIGPAAFAVLFYGVLGGFVVLAVAGAAAASLAFATSDGNARKARGLTVVFALSASLLGAIGLAVLDLFIGPW